MPLFISYNNSRLIAHGGVAQLARATGSYPVGQRFKSTRRYHVGRDRVPPPGPVVKRLRHRPFTAVTRVRFPSGSPKKEALQSECFFLFMTRRGANPWARALRKQSCGLFLARGAAAAARSGFAQQNHVDSRPGHRRKAPGFPSGSPPKGARIPVRVTAERRPDSRPGHRRKAPGFPSGSPPKGARIPVRVTYIPVRVRQKLICYNRNNIPIESKERVQ